MHHQQLAYQVIQGLAGGSPVRIGQCPGEKRVSLLSLLRVHPPRILHRCTGTLISATVVLTAGHCTFGIASAEAWFTETAPSTAEVLSGDYTRGVTGETYTHPDYDDFATFPNTSDVGIVVLDKPVRLSTYGSLPTVGLAETLYKHELFTIVGYGVQDVRPVEVAEVRRLQATVKLVSLQSGYSQGFNLQLSSNPGQPHQGGLCFGDSGGPVLYGTTILAVNSFVINANCAGAEAVKAGETPGGHLVCMRASGVGWLIQATAGSLGGVGGRANRCGVAA
jgi:hypothetical protein